MTDEERREKHRIVSARYYLRHKEKIAEKAHIKRTTPQEREKQRLYANEYNRKNREKKRIYRREYYYRNHEKWKADARDRAKAKSGTPEKNARDRIYMNARYKNNPAFRVMVLCRTRLLSLIKKKGAKKSVSLKIEKDALVKHLESQFLPGMTWENHGKVWHIDHKIPCIEFDLTDPHQVAQCFSFENLRPLWAKDNLRKNRTVLPEFHHLLPKRNAT